ncbi:type II secretion system protein GspJ [Psychrobacter sp. C 20.9]|uniref:type II secretion system minor pseudopilin GspJ n=1 Tax=Psychrobacter sp. C 20.9 TaxID=1926477 RepID=UPI00094724D1|nr:type II secretion system minor pseudopilin GspJ [Psychrobacter sp. C 20.9]OLF35045.1 type II secretion system protein GspJ [Psychrobacter sp. C 20.9]
MKLQRGFTLLELMVAMAIFAMLAVAGWQVFDSVNRTRARAQFHADNLAVLQYAYLQLQQDMAQVIPYQALNTQNNSTPTNSTNDSTSNSNQAGEQKNEIAPEPFMRVDGAHVSFVRFADPDPRYQSSTSLQHIEYIFADERLIRRQYTSIEDGRDSVSLDSVLLEGVTAGRWQAYLPELSTKFPSDDVNNSSNTNIALGQAAGAKPDVVLLPKGIAVNFTYQDMPITWQWALAPQPIPRSSAKAANSNDSNNDNSSDNNNGSNSNNSNSNNSNSGSNTDNSSVGNSN